MLFSKWTIYQGIIIFVFVLLTRFIDLFRHDMAVPMSASSTETIMPMLMMLLFMCAVIGLFSLLMYCQTKKSHTFLKHPLWEKMHILTAFILIVSIVLLMSLFLLNPSNQVVQNNRWLLYLVLYWFLFLMNVFVLALIHKTKKNSISSGRKIGLSFIWTIAVLAVVLFML